MGMHSAIAFNFILNDFFPLVIGIIAGSVFLGILHPLTILLKIKCALEIDPLHYEKFFEKNSQCSLSLCHCDFQINTNQ